MAQLQLKKFKSLLDKNVLFQYRKRYGPVATASEDRAEPSVVQCFNTASGMAQLQPYLTANKLEAGIGFNTASGMAQLQLL